MSQEQDGSKGALFYDTYALYAIATGQQGYAGYAKGFQILTSLMNVYELYYTLCKEGAKDLAEAYFLRLQSCCVPIEPESVRNAANFRLKHISKKFSYIDCLGYTLAKEHNVKFLTGDKEFERMQGVAFVK
jgi:predicted nucleic acid-binding protein